MEEHPEIDPTDLVVEIDGAQPDSIAAAPALAVFDAFLKLVASVGAQRDEPVTFVGLRVIDKCTALATRPDNLSLARAHASESLQLLLSPHRPKFGVLQRVLEARKALADLPDTYSVSVRVSDLHAPLPHRHPEALTLPTAIEVLRVRPIRAGGRNATVKFESVLEGQSFTLKTTPAMARRLGALLYTEVDLEATVVRAVDGRILDGRILDAHELGNRGRSALEEWFAPYAEAWADVVDVEEELDRD